MLELSNRNPVQVHLRWQLCIRTGRFATVRPGIWDDHQASDGAGQGAVAVKIPKETSSRCRQGSKVPTHGACCRCPGCALTREAVLTMSLNPCPNIVVVRGVMNPYSEKACMVMELADGKNLSWSKMESFLSKGQEFLRRRSLDVINGLKYVHDCGIVHCDLKSQNILCFGNEPVLKLSDFGSAKAIERSQGSMVVSGTSGRTDLYMAPEIYVSIYDKTEEPDDTPKTDVYSCTLVIFQILSGGGHPYKGLPDPYRQAKVLGQAPDFPGDVPADVRSVLRRGYSKDPHARPELEEFKEVLSRRY